MQNAECQGADLADRFEEAVNEAFPDDAGIKIHTGTRGELRSAKETRNEPFQLLAGVISKYLVRQVDEVDALVSLLGIARKVPECERYGYDPEILDEIVMRRVRKLARACQDNIEAILSDNPDYEPKAEDFGLTD
jgi:hypothetical protein